MAHITSQTAAKVESHAVPSESSVDLDDSDSTKEGTHCDKSASGSVSSPDSFVEKETQNNIEFGDSVSGSLEDTSCGVKKKKLIRGKKQNKVIRDRSECRTIKGGAGEDSAVSTVVAVVEEGCATVHLATTMERVNHDLYTFGRPGSPYLSSDNDWEASDHSDTDADHSDSSDDDNPTSQVDRMIERGARLIMDGENSNLSSETDDTDDDDDFDDDSDSDITDVSPLVSNAASPLGLSPVMSRRNLPSSLSSKPPFIRHYNHHGDEGDVEDEEEDEHDFTHWTEADLYSHTENSNLDTESDMSVVVQALLKIGLGSRNNSNDIVESIDSVTQNDNDVQHNVLRKKGNMNAALQVNPHHRHLRKTSHSRRKNMSFTNEEVRIINRDNSIILEKLLAVNNRPETSSLSPSNRTANSRPAATAAINRRRQGEGIRKENLALLRRLQEVKPSRAVTAGSRSHTTTRHHHHSSHHHHHSSHHHHHPATTAASSCSVTARQHTTFSPPHIHHHSPKETAL